MVLLVKNLSANAGDAGDKGSIPERRRSPGGGHGNPLQCSCLENPMERRAWQARKESDTTEHARSTRHPSLVAPEGALKDQVRPLGRMESSLVA